MDTWKWLIGLVVVLVLSGVAVIVWAVRSSHPSRRSGPPGGKPAWRERQYDEEGYDSCGYDREGYNKEGYDREGYDRRGYNIHGKDLQGRYNRLYDVAEFAHALYSSEGFLSPQRYPVGVTDHAKERMLERMPGRAGENFQDLAMKAYCFGRSARQLKRTSAQLVQELQERHEDGVVLIYRGYVYIFSSDNQLITVYRNERIPL